jgi:hypothetical protein
MDGWPALLVPLITVFGIIIRQFDFGLRRRLAGHLGLLERNPPEAAKLTLEGLITREAERLVARDTKRLERRLDGATVGTIIFVAVVAGLIAFGLWQLDHLLWRILAGVIAAFAFLLIAVGGLPQLFTSKPPDSAPGTDDEARSAE